MKQPSCHWCATRRFDNTFCGRWKFEQFSRRAARPRHQFTTAIGASAFQYVLCAGTTKCAFKRANPRFGGFSRQIAVTAFAVGAELEHLGFLPFFKESIKPTILQNVNIFQGLRTVDIYSAFPAYPINFVEMLKHEVCIELGSCKPQPSPSITIATMSHAHLFSLNFASPVAATAFARVFTIKTTTIKG